MHRLRKTYVFPSHSFAFEGIRVTSTVCVPLSLSPARQSSPTFNVAMSCFPFSPISACLSLLFSPISACPSAFSPSLSLALTVEVATVAATRNTTKATRHTTNPPLCNQNGDLFVQLTHPTKRKSPHVSTYLLARRSDLH